MWAGWFAPAPPLNSIETLASPEESCLSVFKHLELFTSLDFCLPHRAKWPLIPIHNFVFSLRFWFTLENRYTIYHSVIPFALPHVSLHRNSAELNNQIRNFGRNGPHSYLFSNNQCVCDAKCNSRQTSRLAVHLNALLYTQKKCEREEKIDFCKKTLKKSRERDEE